MTGWLVRWRLALRVARRDASRHKGRTVLVLLMVGLPVLAVVAADTLYRTSDVTPAEALPATLGSADAWLSGESRAQVYADPSTGSVLATDGPADPPWTADEVAAALPPGSSVVPVTSGGLAYRTGFGYARAGGYVDDLTEPLRDGTARLVHGRLPRADDEVAVTPEVAGLGVGDRIRLTRDDLPFRVVGVLRYGPSEGEPAVLVPRSAERLLDAPHVRFYADVPGGLDWPAVHALNQRGLVAVSREVVLDPPPSSAWTPPEVQYGDSSGADTGTAVLALIVASVVLEVVLLAGPAFAVGVRRMRRDLALMGAAGASPADLRRTVLAGGVVLGGGAAIVGALLGIGLARLALPLLDRWDAFTPGPFDVGVRDVLVTVVLGALAGLVAAWFPARQAARTDLVDSLTGRRGQVRTSWRSPVAGLVLVAVGIALLVLGAQGAELAIAAAAVLMVLGLVVTAPWLVGLLAPLARRFPTAGRLAVRDATRNRGRTAPAVAAVMATVAGVTALGIGSTSDSAQSERDYLPQAPYGAAVVNRIGVVDPAAWEDLSVFARSQAPGRSVVRVQAPPAEGPEDPVLDVVRPGCSGRTEDCAWFPDTTLVGSTVSPVAVLEPDAAAQLMPEAQAPDVARALAAGRVAVLGEGAVDARGTLRVVAVRYDPDGSPEELGAASLPATTVPLRTDRLAVPALVLVPPALADRLPVEVRTAQLVLGGPDDPVTPAQEEALSQAAAALAPSTYVYVERGWQDDRVVPRTVLFVLGSVLVLVATLTATGLALTDARPDFATLAAVGAAPRMRRLVAMASAAVVGIGGSVLGLLAGLGPGIAVAYPLTSDDYGTGAQPLVAVPWLMLAGVAVGVPLLAMVVTGLAVRSRLPMVQRLT